MYIIRISLRLLYITYSRLYFVKSVDFFSSNFSLSNAALNVFFFSSVIQEKQKKKHMYFELVALFGIYLGIKRQVLTCSQSKMN